MTQRDKLRGQDLRRRIITGLIGVPIILGITLVDGLPFLLTACLAGLLGGYELAHMIRPAHRLTALLTMLMIVITITAIALGQPLLFLPALAVFLIAGAVDSSLRPESRFVRHFVYALIGSLYIGLSLGLLVRLRIGDDGLMWTLMLFFNNWATDSLALVGGRLYGKRKLAPAISPSKTVEGAAIGLTSGFVLGMAVALAGGVALLPAVVLNIVVALATETGDLLESLVKRSLHVKDSGSILPGHGGVLDRMDGTLLAAPTLFILLNLLAI